MNILLLRNYNPFSESSASGNRFRGLIEGLCREGHHVTIGVTGGLVKYGENKTSCMIDGCNVVYLSRANHYNGILNRLNRYVFDMFHLWVTGLNLNRLMKQKYDIVWLANNGDVLRLFIKKEKCFQTKTLIELNEFNDIFKQEKQGSYFQKRAALKNDVVFRKAIGKIDLFAIMTNTLMSYYQKLAKPEAKFMLLLMTVDLSRFYDVKETNSYQKPYIAYTGTMNNQKDGVDVLLKAFGKIADKYPQLHLYLAGPWHYDVAGQDELMGEMGLSNRVHRLGMVKRDSIPDFICNASVLALSRPDSHQAQGGFPTKLGEYLATGNPVCVTKVGEIPDYLEDNVSAFMAEPGDVDSFANALNRALQDDEKSKCVGAKGKEVAEKFFNAEIQSKKLSEFLKKNVG